MTRPETEPDAPATLIDEALVRLGNYLDENWEEGAGYMETYRPNERVEKITDIDLAEHAKEDRTTLVVDFEGTVGQYDGWRVSDEVRAWFDEAREHGFRVIITTNKQPKDRADYLQMESWIDQTGADLLITPTSNEQRKPSPHMLMQVMQHFEVEADEIVAVGDKLHGDVVAANLAGAHSVLIEDPYAQGNTDHIGDRYLKRPIERLIDRYSELRAPLGDRTYSGGKLSEERIEQVLAETEADLGMSELFEEAFADEEEPESIIPEIVMQSGKIVGHSHEPIELTDEYKQRIPPSIFAGVRRRFDAIAEAIDTAETLEEVMQLKESHDKFLEEHGEIVGEIASLSRVPLAIAARVARELGYRKTATYLRMFADATDMYDGYAIRKSGADLTTRRRKIGAQVDRYADKFAAWVDGNGMVAEGSKPETAQYLQTSREVIRTPMIFAAGSILGRKTSADSVTKLSTFGQNLADYLGSYRPPRSRLATAAHIGATAFKMVSNVTSWHHWKYLEERERAADQWEAYLYARAGQEAPESDPEPEPKNDTPSFLERSRRVAERAIRAAENRTIQPITSHKK